MLNVECGRLNIERRRLNVKRRKLNVKRRRLNIEKREVDYGSAPPGDRQCLIPPPFTVFHPLLFPPLIPRTQISLLNFIRNLTLRQNHPNRSPFFPKVSSETSLCTKIIPIVLHFFLKNAQAPIDQVPYKAVDRISQTMSNIQRGTQSRNHQNDIHSIPS